jgi:type I restriction enzyme S subunit
MSSVVIVTNEAIAHFNLKGGLMTKEFVYCYLKGFNFPSLGSTSSIGTAINSKIVKAIPFIVPGKDAMSSFSMLASPIFEQIENLQNQNIRLKEARDILLPRLMNGKIDLDSCESIAMASEPLVAYSTKRKAL